MKGCRMSFHHLGLAVQRPEKALLFLRTVGYRIPESVHDPEQKVNLVYCTHASMPAVEVIYPADSRGPLDNILKGQDELLYHQCYQTDDLEALLTELRRESRVLKVAPRKAAVLFGGAPVSFYLVAGFGLVEILESP